MRIFIFGHKVLSIAVDLALPLVALAAMWIHMGFWKWFKAWNKHQKIGWMIFSVITPVCLFFYLVFTPNAAYLMAELRHLVLQDGVLDDFNILGIAMFGVIAGIGMATQYYLTIQPITVYKFSIPKALTWIVFVSHVSSAGVAVGLKRIQSIWLITKTETVISEIKEIILSPIWIGYILIGGFAISIVNILLWRKFHNIDLPKKRSF